MAHQPQDPNASKKDSDKKQPETVLLTADELRAIAGGGTGHGTTGTNPPTQPLPTPKDIVGTHITGK